MMNTLSLFPRKTAQPPLVGKTARTCTSITVLFIPGNTVAGQSGKTSEARRNRRGFVGRNRTKVAFRSGVVAAAVTGGRMVVAKKTAARDGGSYNTVSRRNGGVGRDSVEPTNSQIVQPFQAK